MMQRAYFYRLPSLKDSAGDAYQALVRQSIGLDQRSQTKTCLLTSCTDRIEKAKGSTYYERRRIMIR